jgi:uncharacterized protein CbrC (UPF0167 family)
MCAMAYNPLLNPRTLTWDDVDPRRHPFDAAEAAEAVRALAPARRTPLRPTGHAADSDIIRWSHEAGWDWADEMTLAMVERWGRWTVGWRWAPDEGDYDGGPVGAWCCTRDSISATDPEVTLDRIAEALCEWRDWLEDTADRFDHYPLDRMPAEDRQDAWERATVRLVTQVVDRTGGGSGWYGHCRQVLIWFLTRWGVAEETARARVDKAIDGRFLSWTAPKLTLVDDVAERLATSLEADS